MSSYCRMKRAILRGVIWLYLLGFGYMALSLEPGFLDFDNLPDTNFTCVGKVIGGYYADLETNCQMFHVCTIGQMDEPMDIRFLCLNGTVFDQETRVCERIDEVDCSKSEQFYSLNLELYGNSQPSILEENPETEQSLIIKSSTTAKLPTTQTNIKTTPGPYYTSSASPSAASPTGGNPTGESNTITSHHFPLINRNSPDIRFNPEEINISLHPGAPPDIRTNSAYRRQQEFGEKKSSRGSSVQVGSSIDKVVHSDSTSKAQVRYNSAPSSSDINYEINYGQEDSSELQDLPHQNFQYHREGYQPEKYSGNLQPFKSSIYRHEFARSMPKIDDYHLHTPTTVKNIFLQSLKPPSPDAQSHYGDFRTEKPPQRLQLPLPLLPTLPPLTFSTPAPFALHPHIETKRYTKEHHSSPRIIISATASVSDASGRRLNYSLGTIGAQILQQPPTSYDEYREGDVGLDPFYHDVPKIKGSTRKKRSTEDKKLKPTDIIENEQQAVEILKFLFDWYRNDKTNPAKITTPLTSDGISEINKELAPVTVLKFQDDKAVGTNSNLTDSFDRNSSHNNNAVKSHTRHYQPEISNSDNMFLQHEGDYVDDNYEPIVFDQNGEREEPIKTPTNHNGKHKNLNIPEDYVDDNIEPLYYNERNKNDTVTETQEKMSDSEEAKYKIIVIDKAIEKLETHHTPRDVLESSNERDYITDSQTPSNSHLNQSNDSIPHSSIPQKDNNDNNTTVQNKKPLNEITYKLKNNRRRGRRKHIDPNKESNRDNIDFKAILIEKLIEKPYRAKDDYDYLKTVSNVISSTVKTQNLEPIENESNEGTMLPNNSEYNNSADIIQNSESIELPTSAEPLTEPTLPLTAPAISTSIAKSNYRNSRRGKQRYNSGEDKVPHRFRIRNQHSRSTASAISTPINSNDVHNKETDVAHNMHIEEHQSNTFANIPVIDTTQTTPTYGTSNLSNDTHISVNLRESHTDAEHSITSTTESSEKDTAVKEKDHIVQEVATATENSSNFYFQSTETLYNFLENNNITAISVDKVEGDVIASKNVEDGLQYKTKSKIAPVETNPLTDKNRTVSHSQTKIESYKHLSFEDENQTNTVSIISSDENISESQMNNRYSTVHETTTEAEIITEKHQQDPENPENNYIKTSSDNIRYESTTLTNEVGSEEFQTIDYTEESDKRVKSNNSLRQIIETNYSNSKHEYMKTDSIPYEFTTSINNKGNDDYEVINSKKDLDNNVKTNNLIDKISEPYDSYSNSRHQHTKTGSILYGSTTSTNNPKKDEYQTINYEGDLDLYVNSLLPLEITTPLYDVKLYTSPQNDSSYLLSKHKNVDRFEKEDISNKHQKNIQYNYYITSPTATTDYYGKSNELIQSTLPMEITETSYNRQDDILTETETTTEKMKILEQKNVTRDYENIEITTTVLLETGINKEGYHTNPEDSVKEEYDFHRHEESTIKLETTTLNMEVSMDTDVPTTVELATTQMFSDTSVLPETTTTTNNVPDIRITHRRKSRRKGIRPSRIQSSPFSRYRHRFSTNQSTNHPITSENSRYESGYHQQEYYSDEVSTEAPLKNNAIHPVMSKNSRYIIGYHQQESHEVSTEAPLKKNAIPTKSEQAQDKSIPTTPLSKKTVKKHYFFNCFNKSLGKFYPDPRDCRLFHYCTQGYTKNQLLDLKFVCDLNTFFDDKSLICTKEKPTRCL